MNKDVPYPVGSSVLGAVVLIALIVLGFLALMRFDQLLKNKAIDECAKFATFTNETKGKNEKGEDYVAKSTQPINNLYKLCVEDKGYKTGIPEK